VFGIVTAWMRERTGSIAPAFVAHIANSTLLFTVTYILTGWQAGA
jgi:membrane protease YdiL (CAAX protease family)